MIEHLILLSIFVRVALWSPLGHVVALWLMKRIEPDHSLDDHAATLSTLTARWWRNG